MTFARERLRAARRIAVVRTDRLGDLVLTLPMFAALRAHCRGARLLLACRDYAAPVGEAAAVIDEVHRVDRTPGGLRALLRGCDAAFFPRAQPGEAWQGWIARVPLRVGTAYRWYGWMYSHRVHDHRSEGRFHEAEYNTRMVGSALGVPVATEMPALRVEPAAGAALGALLEQEGIAPKEPLLVIHPGSGGSSRDWPADRFGAAAAQLGPALGARVVVTGTAPEAPACAAAAAACPGSVSLCGRLALPQLMALAARSALLVANSTGVLHLAAALGCPVVGLYPNARPMAPGRWRPWSERAAALAPGDGSDAMERITVAEVVAAGRRVAGRG